MRSAPDCPPESHVVVSYLAPLGRLHGGTGLIPPGPRLAGVLPVPKESGRNDEMRVDVARFGLRRVSWIATVVCREHNAGCHGVRDGSVLVRRPPLE